MSEQSLIQKTFFQLYTCSKRSCIFTYAVCVPMYCVLWEGKSGFCWACPPALLNGIRITDSKSWILVRRKLRCPMSSGHHSVCFTPLSHLPVHSFSHSEESASTRASSAGTEIFLLLQIPPSLLSPNCSSQNFRFFSLLNLFLKPFFFPMIYNQHSPDRRAYLRLMKKLL